ncbi:Holliday junction branch migration protein RuvA [Desulfovibrio inopinatus]|uniref:Holliday junction branch migration protein RuvA n=1 Tax=Desulfovibrio inopinatus TaxID=102109 RepID=UPI0004299A98|nr:Holliday junction branch migration protein RuvA [Desulfovibrio inopinatus]
MIGYLEGRVMAKDETGCLLLTAGGVGYDIRLCASVLAELPDIGGQAGIFIHTIVREDALELYGFSSLDEKKTFVTLIGITKLGPKTGLAILSRFSPDDLRAIVVGDDVNALTMVSGIGKKSAQRIFMELKYRLDVDGAPTPVQGKPAATNTFADALTGLTNLGYREDEARAALKAVFEDEPEADVSMALRLALKHMAAERA